MRPWRLRRRLAPVLLATGAVGGLIGADDPQSRPAPPSAPAPPAQAAAAAPAPAPAAKPALPPLVLGDGVDPEIALALAESWPDRPEWVDMLTDIVQGSQMGPDSGWFRTAVTQTRFTWPATRQRLDRDGDGSISRPEFHGSDGDFARLDRDRDGALTEADFDFQAHSLTPTPGLILFSRADADGNGKVSRAEFDALFHQFDAGNLGFLTQADMVAAFPSRLGPPRPSSSPSAPPPGAGGPSRATLVRGLFRQEIGSLQPGPKLDEAAPDFTLRTADGQGEVTLSHLIGPKPVVLIFGNVTCGPFRSHAGTFDKLYQRYKDRATFVMVYVREAHPVDGWRMASNDRVGVATSQPRTNEERVAVAQACGRRLQLPFPVLVDAIDDQVGARYSGMPGRFYLIDRAGRIAFKNGRGPFGFKPDELEQSLVLLLDQTAAEASERGQ